MSQVQEENQDQKGLTDLEILLENVRKLKHNYHVRKLKFEQRRRDDKMKLEKLLSEYNTMMKDTKTAENKLEDLNTEWNFVEQKSFWKRVHRKHVMEDLQDLKVCWCYIQYTL